MTVEELSKNQKLYYWYNHFKAQKESGINVTAYCRNNGLTVSTYYEYKKKIKQLLCDEINTGTLPAVNPSTFVALPKPTVSSHETTFTKGGITVTCGPTVTYSELEPLLKALLC